LETKQLTDQVRKRLLAVVADDRVDGERLLRRLSELRRLEGVDAFSALPQQLVRLQLEEAEARRLLEEILDHRRELGESIGRDPGLRVAALDYLSNLRSMLRMPSVVERSELEGLERSVITDELTGLSNRRHFRQTLDREVRRSRRYSLKLSLVSLDLDAFKSVNDLYGHPFGDLVLRIAGTLMRRAVRESDLACRVGGEEFSMILPETDRLGGHALAERIRLGLERRFAERPIGGRVVGMTLSGGIATYPDDGEEPEALVDAADHALYRAKIKGGNRIVTFHAERRKTIRYPVHPKTRAALTHTSWGSPVDARALNLSRGGALLEIEETRVPPSRIELTLNGRGATGQEETWTVSGRIVRVEPHGGAQGVRLALAFDEELPRHCLMRHVRRSGMPRVGAGGAA